MCTVTETSVARKHKSLLGNREAQFTGLDGFSHEIHGGGLTACLCLPVSVFVCVGCLIS